jgi:hypothetical protein
MNENTFENRPSDQDSTSSPTPSRRNFLARVAGAGAAVVAAPRLSKALPITDHITNGDLFPGDAAILRLLAAAEIIESDLWQQYNELAGIQDNEVPGGTGNTAFQNAITILDGDMPQYIHDNTQDEFSHWFFINEYLMRHGATPVSLDGFRTLPSSQADGAQQIGRITNLTQLTIDTSWWGRYRNANFNPDLDPGFKFAQAVPGLAQGQFTAIPRTNDDLKNDDHLKAIAFTAGFHFGAIEVGGSSLYPSLAQRVTHPEVLRILLSIGPTETSHFQTWHDKAGNVEQVTDPTNGLTFNTLTNAGPDLQANLIMPEPTFFLSKKFKNRVSIIRPTETKGAATAAINGLIKMGLFMNQVPAFFQAVMQLATAADNARRLGFEDE